MSLKKKTANNKSPLQNYCEYFDIRYAELDDEQKKQTIRAARLFWNEGKFKTEKEKKLNY